MNEADYHKIIQHLETVTAVLVSHQGELTDADIRVRHLVSVTISEAKRSLRRVQEATPQPVPGLSAD